MHSFIKVTRVALCAFFPSVDGIDMVSIPTGWFTVASVVNLIKVSALFDSKTPSRSSSVEQFALCLEFFQLWS